MNNKGQMFLGIMLFIFIFIILVITAPVLKEVIELARTPTMLDCNNASISTGVQATCVVIDFGLFYYAASLLGAAGASVMGYFAYKQYVQ
jgi:hypothetical protein